LFRKLKDSGMASIPNHDTAGALLRGLKSSSTGASTAAERPEGRSRRMPGGEPSTGEGFRAHLARAASDSAAAAAAARERSRGSGAPRRPTGTGDSEQRSRRRAHDPQGTSTGSAAAAAGANTDGARGATSGSGHDAARASNAAESNAREDGAAADGSTAKKDERRRGADLAPATNPPKGSGTDQRTEAEAAHGPLVHSDARADGAPGEGFDDTPAAGAVVFDGTSASGASALDDARRADDSSASTDDGFAPAACIGVVIAPAPGAPTAAAAVPTSSQTTPSTGTSHVAPAAASSTTSIWESAAANAGPASPAGAGNDLPLDGKDLPQGRRATAALAFESLVGESLGGAEQGGAVQGGAVKADGGGSVNVLQLLEGRGRLDVHALRGDAVMRDGLLRDVAVRDSALLLAASARLAHRGLGIGGAGSADGGVLLAQNPAAGAHGAAVGVQAAGLMPTASTVATSIDGGAAAQGQAASPALAASPGSSFDEALGQRLVWMVQHGFRDARLHLHPQHLGAIDVRLTLDRDAAQVTVSSPHAVVRETMTQAVPQLRDLLGGAGLMLTHVNVDAGHAGDSGSFDARGSDSWAAPDRAGLSAADDREARAALRLPTGLVDLFA
jgi:flagellar hook-length control protein FliK